MEKNKAGKKQSKITGKSFLIKFLTFLFALLFILAVLPESLFIFPFVSAHIKNRDSVNLITDSGSSGVWQESIISMNNTLKQFAAGSGDRHTGFKDDERASDAVPDDKTESYLAVLALTNGYDTDPYGLILPESNSGSFFSTALHNFYNNLAEQLEGYKSKTGQSGAELQKITDAAGKTEEQKQSSEGQTENQESNSQEQDGQAAEPQTGEDQTTEQLTGPSSQTADFSTALFSLINNARNSNGLPSLSPNTALDSIAKSRCDDMIARDYFSHVNPDGKDIQSLIEENGIIYKATGENIQYCFPPSMAGAELFFNSWMESETHRANILDPMYTKIGIALSFSADKAVSALVFLG